MIRPLRDTIGMLLVFGGLLVLVSGLARGNGSATRAKLFEIERSKNDNVVRYDVKLLPDGSADPAKPVVGYWLKPSGKTKPITTLQKQAYGFEAKYDGKKDTIRIKYIASTAGQKIKSLYRPVHR